MIVELTLMQWDLAYEVMEIFHVHAIHFMPEDEVAFDITGFLPGELPLIQRLHGGAPCFVSTAFAHSRI